MMTMYRSYLTVMLVLAGFTPASLCGQSPPAENAREQAPNTSLGTTSQDKFLKLVNALTAPSFQVRDIATNRLCLLNESYLPALADQYASHTDFEAKRRLRYIIEYIFHRQLNAGRNGFLGITIEPLTVRVAHDPKTEEDRYGIIVKQVQEGFPAIRAGIQNGDIIVRFNEQSLPEDRSTASFIQIVSSHIPGDLVDVTVLRHSKPKTLRVDAGKDPTALLDGATIEFERIFQTFSGLRVLHVEPGSHAEKIGLRKSSTLLSVNGNMLTSSNARNVLRTIIQNAEAGDSLAFVLVETEEVEIPVVLGTRPVELITDEDVLRKAHERFVRFWSSRDGEMLPLRSRPTIRIGWNQILAMGYFTPEVRLLP